MADDKLTSREMEIITREVVIGQRPSLKGKKHDDFRKRLETDIKQLDRRGIPVMIPSEWPD